MRGKTIIDGLYKAGIKFVVERAEFPMEEDDQLLIPNTNLHVQLGDGYIQLWEELNDNEMKMYDFKSVAQIIAHIKKVA